MTLIRLALAGAALAAGLAPGVASAGDPPPTIFCKLYFRDVYIGENLPPVPQPYFVC